MYQIVRKNKEVRKMNRRLEIMIELIFIRQELKYQTFIHKLCRCRECYDLKERKEELREELSYITRRTKRK